jgi:hypothetical protein
MNLRNSAGESATGSTPSAAMRSLTSGFCMATRTSRAKVSTISLGVRAGANMPNQPPS